MRYINLHLHLHLHLHYMGKRNTKTSSMKPLIKGEIVRCMREGAKGHHFERLLN